MSAKDNEQFEEPAESPDATASEDGSESVTDSDSETNPETEEVSELDRELEIFQDLQRLRADFVNYKNRVERDRVADRISATAEVARNFLPALDDIDRAESHGDLEEGSAFSAVAQKLRAASEKLGLVRVGAVGEAFDPTMHDALAQTPNPEVTSAVVADVVEVGYRIGEKEIRPAKVAVFVPVEE